ncbi:MAG: LLM class flavin-dependent oxidoreductase [Chloroflexi bacterium]|nr:LLM class flavin-dependent oxidoreductase [Chloroflexota bacterium]MCL5274646.1 LLM class flavin-dependent oxidoreductase [Chloroflexota bacterium]
MNNIKFGFCLPIFANPGVGMFRTPGFAAVDPAAAMEMGRKAEGLGYDSLWAADHLMLGKDQAIMEGWTTLAALAGMTQRARLGIIHYNNALRHPALTAKMVATLDQISAGRMIHFVDYGNRPLEYLAYGLHDDNTREERIAEMCEGIELTMAMWSGQTVTRQGRFYALHEAVCEPAPVQKPHPPVWIGEAHPDILAATARYAQGWNTTPVSIAELRNRLGALRATCQLAGRDFTSLELSLEMQVLVAPDHTALRRKLQALLSLAPYHEQPDAALQTYLSGATDELPPAMAETWIAGTPEQVAQRVQAYVSEGISHFLLWFVDAPDDSGLRLFAERVAPRFL